MTHISFQTSPDGESGVFLYRNANHYAAAWLLGVPVTLIFIYMFYFLFQLTIHEFNWIDLMISLAVIPTYFFVMVGSAAIGLPLVCPQHVITAATEVRAGPGGRVTVQRGRLPVCYRRKFNYDQIEKVVMTRQERGVGLGFVLYFLSLSRLYRLDLELTSGKTINLLANVDQHAELARAANDLADFMEKPFED